MADSESRTTDMLEEEEEDDTTLDKRKKLFTKELRAMLYAFGDDENPYQETVALLEDVVVQYVLDMTRKALEIGRPGKISVDEIIYLVRNDPKKFSRVKELLLMNEELRRARKAFDEVKYSLK